MTTSKHLRKILSTFACLTYITACGSSPSTESAGTLADLDKPGEIIVKKDKKTIQKSQDEIRRAYRTYVENATTQDSSRQKALTRLAQLELELSTSLSKEDDFTADKSGQTSQSLNNTIRLLETSLRDYPDAPSNDQVLYQLAQAYDRTGQYQKSLDMLDRLVTKYPRSLQYPEAQFRLGEAAFARGDYLRAEDAYTEVLLSPSSDRYYEKSLFKRGWTRYKQQLYSEATSDYVDAFEYHEFDPNKKFSDSEQTQFEEYLRALGLAFSYQRGQISVAEYFSQRPNFPFLYDTYLTISDIFLKQERYSDAAEVLEEYTQSRPNSKNTPLAEQKIIAAWREGGFTNRLYQAIEKFYASYQPGSNFWRKLDAQSSEQEAIFDATQKSMRNYIVQVSAYFHDRYQQKRKADDYAQASRWYQRYLDHYTSYANQDNIYTLYAELLLDGQQKEQALNTFALAAYDGEIILDKKAAYSTIVLSAELLGSAKSPKARNAMLEKHLAYSQRYVDLYPNDPQSQVVATSAAERAFNAKLFDKAIALANFVPDSASEQNRLSANNIKARSYLELAEYADAEAVYLELLDSRLTKRMEREQIQSSLALAIYRQAEAAKAAGQTDIALRDFTRISRVAPESTLAATGLYDAIAMSMQAENWNQAIALIEEFNRRHPRHSLSSDVSKKLSVAYLNSDQKGKAAQEFERIAQFEGDVSLKKAALWKAAELYESKKNYEASIRAYRDYANTYATPYEQNMEAMYKLAGLYEKTKEPQKRYFWQNKIRKADQRATKRAKTERTTFIASTTTLDLAQQKKAEFDRRRLVEPIATNLKLKKSAMQESVKLFGLASAYGVEEITTSATKAIGDIYLEFSKSLLQSERPGNLNADELEQYEILLEDQAFPFEEKAIEFYETNLARTRDGTFNSAIESSFSQLVKLFPVRYQRKGKTDVYRD